MSPEPEQEQPSTNTFIGTLSMNTITGGTIQGGTPEYVHRLMDALLRHTPVDFDDVVVPSDVLERLKEHTEAAERLGRERDVDYTDAHMTLIGRLGEAVAAEFERSLGIELKASRDDTWLKAGDGIAFRVGLQHVGWYHEEGERAHMFVRADAYPKPPDDGRDWHPVYAIA